jgi:DNA-binding response OmpR family regulator
MASRILVIDNTEAMLELFRVILEAEGYEVHVSPVIFEDLADIEQLHPDLIILDCFLGKKRGGWYMLEELKMHEPTASVPVIICTAAVTDVYKRRDYLERIGVRVLFKPFDIDDFLQQVQHALQQLSSNMS